MNSIQLSYLGSYSNAKGQNQLFSIKDKRFFSLRHDVTMTASGMDIRTQSQAKTGRRSLLSKRHYDYLKGEVLHIEQGSKTFLRQSLSKLHKGDDPHPSALQIKTIPGIKKQKIGGHLLTLRRKRIETEDVSIELSYALHPLPKLSHCTQDLYVSLFGKAGKNPALGGLPVKVSISDENGTFTLNLSSFSLRERAPLRKPSLSGLKNLSATVLDTGAQRSSLLKNIKRPQLNPELLKLRLDLEKKQRELETRGQELKSKGADMYWGFNQSLLDRFRELLNALIGGQRFTGEGSESTPMHLDVNLLDRIKGRLDYESPFYEQLNRLLLYLKVTEGSDLPIEDEHPLGLTLTEKIYYAAIQALQPADPFNADLVQLNKLARLNQFGSRFPAQRRTEIGEALFAGMSIAGNKRIELGPAVINANPEFARVRIRDFDTSLTFESEWLRKMEITDRGTIQLVVAIDEIHVDYFWGTYPNGSLSSWICNILTLGACSWALQTNEGVGFFKIKEARLLFDMVPLLRGGKVKWRIDASQAGSNMDISTFNFGLNPVASVVSLLTSIIVSWWDDIAKSLIFDGIKKGLEDFRLESFLNWAEELHHFRSPRLRADIGALSPGQATFAGDVARIQTPNHEVTETPQVGDAQQAFFYSLRYLEEWLRRMIGVIPEQTWKPLNVQQLFGLRLPPPETHDQPIPVEPGNSFGFDDRVGEIRDMIQDALNGQLEGIAQTCLEKPASPPPVFANTSQILRYAPVVKFPEPGSSDVIGTVEMRCLFYIKAVRRREVPVLLRVPRTCFELEGVQNGKPVYRPQGGGAVVDPERVRPMLDRFGVGERGYKPDPNDPSPGGGLPDPRDEAPGGFPGVICEDPHCEWEWRGVTDNLFTYLQAEVKVTADLIHGFDPFGQLWLPGTRLMILKSSIQTEIPSLTLRAPFDQIPQSRIENILKGQCQIDAERILRRALQNVDRDNNGSSIDPQVLPQKKLIPTPFASLLALVNLENHLLPEIVDLLTYTQVPSADNLNYQVSEDYAKWSFELRSDLFNHFR